MQLKKEFTLIASTWHEAAVPTHSAAVAYYTIFSIAPLLIIAVSLASLIFDNDRVENQVVNEFSKLFGNDGATLIESLLTVSTSPTNGIIGTYLGIILLIVGAMGIFNALQRGLDQTLEVLPDKRPEGIYKTIFKKVVSIGMVFSLGFVLIVSLILSALLSVFGDVLKNLLPAITVLLPIVNTVLSYLLISLFLAGLFVFLPTEKVTWRPALYGGLLAGVFFIVGKQALSLYFTMTDVTTAYGAASSLVLVILWTYYLSQTLFFSAIIMRLYFVPPLTNRLKQ